MAKPTPILFHWFDRVRDALEPMMTNAWAALQAPEQKTPRLLQWFRGVACALVSVVAASINALASAMGLRTSDPTVEAVDELIGEPVPPMQQIRVKVDGATVMIDAATNWTENNVKVALAERALAIATPPSSPICLISRLRVVKGSTCSQTPKGGAGQWQCAIVPRPAVACACTAGPPTCAASRASSALFSIVGKRSPVPS